MTNNKEAAQAIRDHHARLVSNLQSHVDLLADDIAAGRDHHGSARGVLAVLEEQILPHAAAEERGIYPLASSREDLRTLVQAMIGEHQYLGSAIAALRSADGVAAAARAEAISTVFRLHAGKENDFLLPALAADPTVDLSEVLSGMHAMVENPAAANSTGEQQDGA